MFHLNTKRRYLTIHADIRHLLDFLVSVLAVCTTAFRSRLSLQLHIRSVTAPPFLFPPTAPFSESVSIFFWRLSPYRESVRAWGIFECSGLD